jgi:glutathione S-transferase/maleylpyruvate isomerase
MLIYYASPVSLYCAKLRILLRHKQVEWQEVHPDGGYNAESFRQLVPAGTMPAIADGELVLADSEAIAEYLEETHPQPAMLPREARARARCRERSRFHDTRLEPEVRKLFAHVGVATASSDMVRVQSAALNQRFAELSRLLAADTTLDTSQLSLGDCGLPVSFAWIDAFVGVMGLALEWPQNLRDYRAQIEQHAAVREELAAYAPAMDAWLKSKLDPN